MVRTYEEAYQNAYSPQGGTITLQKTQGVTPLSGDTSTDLSPISSGIAKASNKTTEQTPATTESSPETYTLKALNDDGTYKKEKSTTGASIWTAVKDIGGSVLAAEIAGNPQTALNEYQTKIEEWKNQGKYWMTPGNDTRPFIDDYMSNMPSRVKSDIKGSTFGRIGSGLDKKTLIDSKAATGFIGATAGSILSGQSSPGMTIGSGAAATQGKNLDVSAQDFVNPAGYLAKMFGASDEQVNYIWGKSTDNFVETLVSSGNIITAAASGVIGIIQGAFGYNDALEADRAAKKAAMDQYERDLAEWTYQKNSRLMAAQVASVESAKAHRKAAKQEVIAEQETTAKKKLTATNAMRANLVSALTNTSSISDAERKARISRWGNKGVS